MATHTVALNRVAELRGTIGLDDYEIFDEDYRPRLNKKIFEHFFNQEIGQESVDMFLGAMSRLMNEIMPEYNQLYLSQQLKIDPLNTMSIKTVAGATTKQTSASKESSKNESISDANGQVVNSEFPQTQLQRRKDYGSSGTESTNRAGAKSEADGTTDVDSSGEDTSDSETTGWQGSQAMLLMQYRATYLNIDLDIIKRIEQAGLFFFVWSSGDQFFNDNPYRIGYGY